MVNDYSKSDIMKSGEVKSRTASFLIILAIYILAFFAGFFIIRLLGIFNLHILISFFIANLAATIVVWIFGIIFNNSSVYDPYWSVAPLVILPGWMIAGRINFTAIGTLVLAAIIIWGMRLTFNWAMRWRGLSHQDWRYTMLKANSPKMWFLTNLVGINVMPTVIVYLALMPAFYAILLSSETAGQKSTALTGPGQTIAIAFAIAGFLICLSSVAIQAISDKQMDIFRKNNLKNNMQKIGFPGRHIDRGLWRYSRHPNYFGEILFWWGIWVMQIGVVFVAAADRFHILWATAAGPIIMTLLFVFISIPMMEKYIMSSKPSYADYKKEVSMLIPWFRFKL